VLWINQKLLVLETWVMRLRHYLSKRVLLYRGLPPLEMHQ
jgi:hypothetical protein